MGGQTCVEVTNKEGKGRVWRSPWSAWQENERWVSHLPLSVERAFMNQEAQAKRRVQISWINLERNGGAEASSARLQFPTAHPHPSVLTAGRPLDLRLGSKINNWVISGSVRLRHLMLSCGLWWPPCHFEDNLSECPEVSQTHFPKDLYLSQNNPKSVSSRNISFTCLRNTENSQECSDIYLWLESFLVS